MNTSILNYYGLRQWVKERNHPVAKVIYQSAMHLKNIEVPSNRKLWSLVYVIYKTLTNTTQNLMRILVWTPMFKSRVKNQPASLYLYSGLPFLSGPLDIKLGDYCRISGQTTFTGRSASKSRPELIIGSNVDIGWQTTIAVGHKVILGDNVRIAGRAFLAGYPGHPLDPYARAQGEPCLEQQVGDIILENDVWLATGVSVMAGVTIGKGTVVAAGSVVTKSLPAYCLAGGVPAKVIRPLPSEELEKCDKI